MSSQKKLNKVSKRNHWGRDGRFLKGVQKVKGIAFYNASDRRAFKDVEK